MSNKGLYGSPTGRKEGSGGSITYKNFARNFGLSPSDMGKTVTVNTSNGYNLVLPDCRQISSQRFIVIKNVDTVNLLVTNNGGTGIKTVAPNSSVVLACTDVSTANGVWSALAGTNLSALYVGSAATVKTTVSNITFESICALSPTVAVCFYSESTVNKIFATALTISGTNISVGGAIEVLAGSILYGASICALDATHAIVFYSTSPNSYAYANILEVISGNITVGVQAAIHNTGVCEYQSICALDATHAVAFYLGTSNFAQAKVITTSGNTITNVSAATTIYGSTAVKESICALDSTHAVAFYQGAGSYAYASLLTINTSTGAITVNDTKTVYNVAATDYQSICALDSTHAVAFYQGAGSYAYANILTISGLTIGVGATSTIESAVTAQRSICALNSTQAIGFYTDSSGYPSSNVLTISGLGITAGNKITLNSSSASYESIAALPTTSSAIAFYRGASNYAYANVLAYTQ